MKISDDQIITLQKLLNDVLGLNYTQEEAQQAGNAIIRFVAVKRWREQERQKIEAIIREENGDGQLPGNYRATQ